MKKKNKVVNMDGRKGTKKKISLGGVAKGVALGGGLGAGMRSLKDLKGPKAQRQDPRSIRASQGTPKAPMRKAKKKSKGFSEKKYAKAHKSVFGL